MFLGRYTGLRHVRAGQHARQLTSQPVSWSADHHCEVTLSFRSKHIRRLSFRLFRQDADPPSIQPSHRQSPRSLVYHLHIMNDAPPPYTEIENAVKEAFDRDPKGAQAAFAKVLKEQSASVLVKQSNDLATTVTILKKSFENVSQSLVKIDRVVKDGGPRFPVWQTIYHVRGVRIVSLLLLYLVLNFSPPSSPGLQILDR
jgi:hypothetical protein